MSLEVNIDGPNVTVNSGRSTFHAEIGKTYSPIGNVKTRAPKKLYGVGLVGDEWHASIGPESEGEGRTRGMQLLSFLNRYVPRESTVRLPKHNNNVSLRIERKLDWLLKEFGISTADFDRLNRDETA